MKTLFFTFSLFFSFNLFADDSSYILDSLAFTSDYQKGAVNEVLIDDAQAFKSFLNSTSAPVLVEFWQEGCRYCVEMDGKLPGIAAKANYAYIIKVNLREMQNIQSLFPSITSIPAMFFLKNGVIRSKMIGSQPESQILRTLQKLK